MSFSKMNISKKIMDEYRGAFNLIDKDRDGCVSKEELKIVMHSLGQHTRSEEYRSMLEEVDADGDGKVSFEEFVLIMACNKSLQQEDDRKEMMDAFKIFDKRNRGYICASDLRTVLHCLGEELNEDEIDEMIREVDTNGDGRIDFEEFAEALVKGDTNDDETVEIRVKDTLLELNEVFVN